MKGDLNIPKVEGVEVAAIMLEGDDQLWDIIIINRNSHPLKNVLIASKGYGEFEGEKKETSTLRHMIETLPPNSFAKVEPIQTAVFHLTNEYWVSYYLHNQMYDKKYIFLPDAIQAKKVSKIYDFNLIGIVPD